MVKQKEFGKVRCNMSNFFSRESNCAGEAPVDNVNPKHYKDGITLECIDCMTLIFGANAVCHFCLCNAFKYMWRYKNKNGEEDLNKAEWYLNYVEQDIENNCEEVSDEIKIAFYRLNDLFFNITDKINKEGE